MYERETTLVKSMYSEILETARRLTEMKRGSKYLPGLEKTAHFLRDFLQDLGCEVELHYDETYGNTVIGRKKGTGKMKLLWYAHMDTVWSDPERQVPFRIEGDKAYGAGISDCTHGLLASLYTLKALNELGFDQYGELTILFNPDEELTSPSSTKWLKACAKGQDLAICMEGPERADQFTTARAGSAYYEINITGKMAHAGVNPEEGANALVEMTYKLNEILAKEFPDVYLVLCWIRGGSGDCCVADNAYAMLRYRIKTWDVKPEIDAFLQSVEAKVFVPGTTTRITFWPEGGFGPMPRLPWIDKFVDLVHQTSDEFGNPIREAYAWGGCDAASTVMECPTLDGLTPVSYNCHNPEESLDLSTIVPRISLLTVLMEKWCTDEKFLRKEEK